MRRSQRRGLSAIEVLVSIGIVFIILSILVKSVNVFIKVKSRYQPQLLLLEDIQNFYIQLNEDLQKGASFFCQDSNSFEKILLDGTVNLSNLKTQVTPHLLSWIKYIGAGKFSCWGQEKGALHLTGEDYKYVSHNFKLSDQGASHGLKEGGLTNVVYTIQNHPQINSSKIIKREEFLCDANDFHMLNHEMIDEDNFFIDLRGTYIIQHIEQSYQKQLSNVTVRYTIEILDTVRNKQSYYQIQSTVLKDQGLA